MVDRFLFLKNDKSFIYAILLVNIHFILFQGKRIFSSVTYPYVKRTPIQQKSYLEELGTFPGFEKLVFKSYFGLVFCLRKVLGKKRMYLSTFIKKEKKLFLKRQST